MRRHETGRVGRLQGEGTFGPLAAFSATADLAAAGVRIADEAHDPVGAPDQLIAGRPVPCGVSGDASLARARLGVDLWPSWATHRRSKRTLDPIRGGSLPSPCVSRDGIPRVICGPGDGDTGIGGKPRGLIKHPNTGSRSRPRVGSRRGEGT